MIETYLNIFKKTTHKNTFESFNHRNVDQLLLFKILSLVKSKNSSKACPKIKLFIYPTIFRSQEGKKEHTLQCMNNFRAPKPLFFERKTEGTYRFVGDNRDFKHSCAKNISNVVEAKQGSREDYCVRRTKDLEERENVKWGLEHEYHQVR